MAILNIVSASSNLMELDQTISVRRSIRQYQDRPVPREIVNKILKAGVWAPSGMNMQPWHFVIIQNRDIINRLSQKTKQVLLQGPWPESMKDVFKSDKDVIFYNAPLLILICVPRNEDFKTVNFIDCGLATENMFLTAYQEGLGSCFIGFANFLSVEPQVLEEIGVPKDHELVAPLIFGYPAEKPIKNPREAKILKWLE
jgi:nitroreductase